MNMRVDSNNQQFMREFEEEAANLHGATVEKAKTVPIMGDVSVSVDEAKGKDGKSVSGPLSQHDIMPPPDHQAVSRVAASSSPPKQTGGVGSSQQTTPDTNPYASKLGGDMQQAATAGLMAAMSAEIKQAQTNSKSSEVSREAQLGVYESEQDKAIKEIHNQASDVMNQALTEGITSIAAGCLTMAAGGLGSGTDDVDPIDDDVELNTLNDSGIADQDDLTGDFDENISDDDNAQSLSKSDEEEDIDDDNDEDEKASEEEETPQQKATEDEEEAKETEEKESESEKKRKAIEKNTEAREKQIEEMRKTRIQNSRSLKLQGLASLTSAGGKLGGAGYQKAGLDHSAAEKTDEKIAGVALTASQTDSSFEQQFLSSQQTVISMMGQVLSSVSEGKVAAAKA